MWPRSNAALPGPKRLVTLFKPVSSGSGGQQLGTGGRAWAFRPIRVAQDADLGSAGIGKFGAADCHSRSSAVQSAVARANVGGGRSAELAHLRQASHAGTPRQATQSTAHGENPAAAAESSQRFFACRRCGSAETKRWIARHRAALCNDRRACAAETCSRLQLTDVRGRRCFREHKTGRGVSTLTTRAQ